MNKKIIIIFSVLILVFILVYFFVFRIGKNTNPEIISDVSSNASSSVVSESVFDQASSTQVSSTQASSTQVSLSSTPDTINNSEVPVDIEAVNKKFTEYIPKTTSEQISTFSGIAAKGDMSSCEDLSGEADNCKYYFSVYKNQDGLCGDIETNSVKLDCYTKLIFDNLSEKIKKCDAEQVPDMKVSCLNYVFWGNETANSCEMFTDDFIRQICADSVNLRIILEKNKDNCPEIKDAGLKTFCDQHFVPGDFDKDGLSDAEELKIGTNPYSADTDGDGYSDKEEIGKGYNPCGDGLMPTPAKLLEMCAALKK